MPRVPCNCGNKDKWTSEIVRSYKDQRFHTATPTLKMWRPWSREVTEQQIQEELDNAFNQVDADRRAPPMENQQVAVQEQKEQILADYGDQDESDADIVVVVFISEVSFLRIFLQLRKRIETYF